MKKPLDIGALLERNPQVDRQILAENEMKIQARKEPLTATDSYGLAVPYGGRRMTHDDGQRARAGRGSSWGR